MHLYSVNNSILYDGMFRAKRATDILKPVNATVGRVLRGDKQVRVRVVVDERELDGVVRRSACDTEARGEGDIASVLTDVLRKKAPAQRIHGDIAENAQKLINVAFSWKLVRGMQ